MKPLHPLILLLSTVTIFAACTKVYDDASLPYRIIDGTVVFDTPTRPDAQEDMLAFAAAPIDTLRVGFVGLGMRGPDAVERFTYLDGTVVAALCDIEPDRVEKCRQMLLDKGLPEPALYTGAEGYKDLCQSEDIDLVYICTNWQMHVEIALCAMDNGKHVAVEVPAATSLNDCWKLVDASERTRRHCMMLENCTYDFFELTTLNMVRQGLFGEVLHAEGAYIHNLEPYWDEYYNNWRLDFNRSHRGDVYPTHGFGPDCQIMNIHRGDRLARLVSMDTKSVCGLDIARQKMGAETFANGDQTSTLISTANGKSILLQHNVYTPRPYDRMYQVVGTKGYAQKYPKPNYSFDPSVLPDSIDKENISAHSFVSESVRDTLRSLYAHPISREIEALARQVGGHGGMDFIMDYRLVYCLRNGLPLDMDVYDAAEWSCVGELSAISIARGNLPVQYPDFTRGNWNKLDGLHFAH